jgi:uncharacterized protein (DUF433 family)
MMAEFIDKTLYITKNQHGTPVLAETNTNIVPIGVAHENGADETQLIEQYGITRAQLHAALSYFYEHREELRAYEAETQRLLQQYSTSGKAKLEALRKRA